MSRRRTPELASPPTEAELKVIRAYRRRTTITIIAEVQGLTHTVVEDTLNRYQIHYPEDAAAFLAEYDSPRGEPIVSTTAPTLTKPRLATATLDPNGANAPIIEPDEPEVPPLVPPLVSAAELSAGLDALDLDDLHEALAASVDSDDEQTRSTAAMLLGLAANLTGRVQSEMQALRSEVTSELSARRAVLTDRHAVLSGELEVLAAQIGMLTDPGDAVRVWSHLTGTPCPEQGVVPPRLVKAWLASLPPVEE